VALALQKDPAKRCKSGLDFAAELTRVHQKLREHNSRIDRQEQFGVLAAAEVFSRVLARGNLGSACAPAAGRTTRLPRRSSRKARWTTASTSSCRATAPSNAIGTRLGTLDTGDCFGEASYVEGAKRTATIRAATCRHGTQGELDAPRAGLGLLPAALQPGFPAHAHRAPAERGFRPELNNLPRPLAGAARPSRCGRRPNGCGSTRSSRLRRRRRRCAYRREPRRDITHHVLDELRMIVGMLGHVFLIGALQDAVELRGGFALGDVDEFLEPDVALQLRGDGDVRALIVRAVG
jgi:hypothetical protein